MALLEPISPLSSPHSFIILTCLVSERLTILTLFYTISIHINSAPTTYHSNSINRCENLSPLTLSRNSKKKPKYHLDMNKNMNLIHIFFSIYVSFTIFLAQSAPQNAIVSQVPGFNGTLPSKHYAGYS